MVQEITYTIGVWEVGANFYTGRSGDAVFVAAVTSGLATGESSGAVCGGYCGAA